MTKDSKSDSQENLNHENLQSEIDDVESNTEKSSLEHEEYESLRQKLLDEYAKYTASYDTDDADEEQIQEDELADEEIDDADEEQTQEDELADEEIEVKYNQLQQNLSEEYAKQDFTAEEHGDNAKYKYDLDEESELEIEDVTQSDGKKLDQPKELTDKQKAISPEVEQGNSKVAISKGSSLLMMIGLGLGLIFVIYQVMSPSSEELATQTHSEIDKNLPITKPINDTDQTIVVPEIPKLPEVPKLAPPTAPPAPTPPIPPTIELNIPTPPPPVAPKPVLNPAITPPPAATSTAQISTIVTGHSAEEEAAAKAALEKKRAKMNSAMLAGGAGGGSVNKNINPEGQSLTSLSRNSNVVVATYIGDLKRIIGQGKVIDAVLETAINTDLPGSLRAVVSRDVYSESGKNVLISRGSRLIGTYNSNVAFGIARVQITWNRVIRPDGVDVQISSPGIDNLGRSGTAGTVDNHILRNLSTALMVSALDVGLATYLDKNTDTNSNSTQVTVSGGVSTTGSASATGTVVTPTTTVGTPPSNVEGASAEALQNIQEVGKQIMAKTMAMPPTITIDQGTPLKVYIQRDILFPGSSANLTKVIE